MYAIGTRRRIASTERSIRREENENMVRTITSIILMTFGVAGAAENPLVLKPVGEERVLHKRILGINAATAFYEDLTEDTRKIAPTRELAPALLRFPGGTIANYYNWQSGQIEISVKQNSSTYTRMMGRIAQYTRRLHPGGVSIDQFHDFSQKVGSEILLVLNLETSTLEEQVAWLKGMKERGIVPRYIELGNEFWIAMVGDPNVLKKFPDAPTSMKLMKRYTNAIKPFLPEDAVIAAQSAGSDFHTSQSSVNVNPLMRRMHEWDKDLFNEPWFDAVTVHLYPEPDVALGVGASSGLPGNIDKVFPAMMARVDDGVDRTIRAIAKRHPGKEIWVTEWNPNGVRFFFQQRNPGLTGLMIHCTTRMILAFLRSPAVTMSTFHMLSFRGGPYSVFAPRAHGEDFMPVGPGTVLRWFNEAANGGAKYRFVKVEGAERIPGGGAFPDEVYNDVEAAQFIKGTGVSLLIHNASKGTKRCKLTAFKGGKIPSRVETFDTPDLMKDYASGGPVTRTIEPSSEIEVPAYSVTRVIWD
jgi:hypothetical protein